jgi:glycosyltransferase involved in cell wall biosynthesis
VGGGRCPALAGLQPNTHAHYRSDETPELAEVYAAADVFVFPSKTDTFGLVLLETLYAACRGAYPVPADLDVLGDSPAGVMHEDLREACMAALNIERHAARAHAEKFSWRAATEQFVGHLHPTTHEAMPA